MDNRDSGNRFDDDLSEYFDDYEPPSEVMMVLRYERLLTGMVLTTRPSQMSQRAWITALKAIAYKLEQHVGPRS